MSENRFFSFMNLAIEEAQAAGLRGEVPVGAVIVHGPTRRILSKAGNRTEENNDPTGHAEIYAIQQAAQILQSPRLIECDLYVTLEPCAMCAAAISFARIRNLYYGAEDQKSGGVENGGRFFNQPTCHHKPTVFDGIEASTASKMLKEFFQHHRKN